MADKDSLDLQRLLGPDTDGIDRCLHDLAERSASHAIACAWRRARRAFFQSVEGGRPAIDDAPALAEICSLVAQGRTPGKAINLVARKVARHDDWRPVYER